MKKSRGNDRGDVVLGWLAKVAVGLTILGIIGFDGIALLHTQFTVSDTANQAAVAASHTWQDTKDTKATFASAEAVAAEAGATVPTKGIEIAADGSVRVTLHETAHTFLLSHLGGLKSFADLTGHGTAQPAI
ncbi:MAG: hypothetical protein WCB04_05100 [Mycobacteriales bacterium]